MTAKEQSTLDFGASGEHLKKHAVDGGLLITFEGGEGVGKSTQVKRLSNLLDNFGIQNIVTREPGGSTGAEEIRELLVEGQRAPIVGRRGIEHTVIDVTRVPGAEVGSEAVLLGAQGHSEITPDELAGWLGLPILELLPRLARTLPKVYLQEKL